MANALVISNALLDSANEVANTYGRYLDKQAELSTQTKNIQLQNDINGKLAQIRQSSNYEDWNTEINNFFTQIKSGMSNKDSPYYCQNNLQAEQFNRILEQNQVNISDQIGRMVQQRQGEKEILDVQNAKTQLAQMTSGQTYIDQANELDRGLYENGRISLEQYQQQKDLNYIRAYENMRIQTFDASLSDALAQNKSFEAFYADIEKSMPELKATDTDGLERVMDKESLNAAIKKTCLQNYKARLSDIQQNNANSLSQIVQEMRQQNTAEGKVNAARRGQMAMNRMRGLQLSEQDRLQYSALFELALGGDTMKGSKSGSGSGSDKPSDSYEKLIQAAPDTALQLWLEGKSGNLYDVTQTVSNAMTEEWYTSPYKENYGKTQGELDEDFNLMYKGKISSENLTNAVIKKVAEKFPTAKNYMDNNFKNLITDIQKNPKQYGTATVGALSNFILDWVSSADASMTDEDFMNAFKQHVNDCYVERIKYVELDKKGNLEKKFNANNEKDIARAARLASEKDFVYTYNGQEVWAAGKKEALEAEGGIKDVLTNAVVGTLGIPASERGSVGFQYVQSRDDMTSQPVITYKNKAYEVIPNDDDKGFKLREVHTGEIIEGSLGGKKAKEERIAEKQAAKAEKKAASREIATLRKEREQAVDKAITESKAIPKAMKAAGKVEKEEWETISTVDVRKEKLNMTETKINADAKNVQNNEMSAAAFKSKYGIDYNEWIKNDDRSAHYELILKS